MSPRHNQSPDAVVRDIKRKTRRKFSSEEKIRIVLEGLKGDILGSEIFPGTVQENKSCICKKILGKGDNYPLNTIDNEDFIERCREK